MRRVASCYAGEMARGFLVFGFPLLLACGARQSTSPSPTPRGAGAGVDAPRRRAIVETELGGKSLKPHVRGVLAGRPVLFLLDTGASSHVLSASAAQKAGLAITEIAASGSDHSGAAVKVKQVAAPPIAIEGIGAVAADGVLVVDLPPFFDGLGIAGILNPQLLARDDEDVVLDFTARQLSLEPRGTTLPPKEHGSVLGRALSACGQPPKNGVRSRLFILSDEVDGQPTQLELDTGASTSDVFASSPAGAALVAKSSGNGVMVGAAGAFETKQVDGVRLHIGDIERTVRLTLIPGASKATSCPTDGVLGMDVVQSCVLVFRGEKMDGWCTDGNPHEKRD